MTRYAWIDSPLGPLLATADEHGLTSLCTPGMGVEPAFDWQVDEDGFDDVRTQLDEYFAGSRTEFDVPLAPAGTPFQQDVWAALRKIPYGQTATYGEIARRIGRPAAVRAVGLANGRNPISIIVPCHRVIGANGKLTGYAGGLEAKRTLLDLEAGVTPLG